MPINGTAARGLVNLCLEVNPGEISLLAPTAISPTMTLTTQPSGTTGQRLHIRIFNHTASGTLTLNGFDILNNALTENVTVPTPVTLSQPTQSPQVADFEYVTTNAYGSVTNITSTGATNGVVVVTGIQAGKYLIPSNFKPTQKITMYSPNEFRGIIERDVHMQHQLNEVSIDTFEQDLYPDLSLWWPYMLLGAPAQATLPASPTSLKTAAVIASSMSLTTQPTMPGMKLILAITAYTATVTLTINGTNTYNQSVNESIVITGNGTYYSSNVYTNVSSITSTGTTATLAVTGVFGWLLTWLSGGSAYTAAIEFYDGTESLIFPFSFITEGDFDAKVNGETKLSCKGRAQDKLPIGDRTTSPMNASRVSALGQPLADIPMSGWQGLIFIDPISGTPQTTQYYDMEDLKVSIKSPIEPKYTLTNSQNYNRAYAGKRQGSFEATVDFLNLAQFEQFRQNLKQYLVAQWQGPTFIGTTGGTTYYKSWTWTLPFRHDGEFEPDSGPDKTNVEAKIKGACEYDAGIGGIFRLQVVTQMPPVYNQ